VVWFALAVAWFAVVTLLCAGMRQATRAPWWEAILCDLDSIDVAVRAERTYARHDRTI
jgi:hypothetical protein